MPIASDEFEKGRKIEAVERRVLDFLKKNKNKAFTQTEILNALYPSAPNQGFWTGLASGLLLGIGVENALKKLVDDGLVKGKQITGEIYYRAS